METLYCILYKNGNLFINLFAMMLSTGIPELKSLEDIHYFRDMLALSKTEEDCRKVGVISWLLADKVLKPTY